MAKTQQIDLQYPDHAPPPYITSEQGISNTDTIISFPEVIVNNPDEGKDTEILVDNFVFNDKQIRHAFIRKVYSIILVQLIITAAVIAWLMNDTNFQMTVKRHLGVFLLVSLIVYLTSAFVIFLFEAARRRIPYNFIILLIFTLAASAMVGIITMHFNFQEIMIAGGITFAIVLALTIFAFQTRIDFTVFSGSLLCVLLVFSLFGFAMIFSPFPALRLLYSAIGVLIMCVYLVYDTQMMVGGKHTYAISPEEYVFAAINIYIDIIYIFIKILRFLRY